MTRADELLALAARIEHLTGPDREVDAEIAVAVSGDKGAWVVGPSPQSVFAHQPGWYRTSDDKSHQAPTFTASLDAAMTLVFEGAGFNLDRYWIREGARWKVEIATGGIPENPRKVFDCWDAYSAALATAAAALRARAALAAIETGAAA